MNDVFFKSAANTHCFQCEQKFTSVMTLYQTHNDLSLLVCTLIVGIDCVDFQPTAWKSICDWYPGFFSSYTVIRFYIFAV